MEIAGYIAVIGVGLLLGSIGAGGSMLSVPILVYLFSMDMETASGYSLFIVGATSLTGAVLRQKEQLVSIKAALFFGIPSVISVFIARNWIVTNLPKDIWRLDDVIVTKSTLLLVIFSLLMLASAITILYKAKEQSNAPRPVKILHLIPIGFVTGLIAGLAGSGGGFLILPALIIFAALPFSIATGTSLLIIASNSLLGFCGDWLNRPINWNFLFFLTALAIGGLLLGYGSRHKIPMAFAQRCLAWFMIIVGVSILTSEFVL